MTARKQKILFVIEQLLKLKVEKIVASIYKRKLFAKKMIVTRPRCTKMCEGKAFLLSRASFSSSEDEAYKMPHFIENAKHNIEVRNGAKAGAGHSGRYLTEAGFTSNKPLGANQLIQSNDLLNHHDKDLMDSGHPFWIDAWTEYAEATKHGILIIAVQPEYLQIWASARASLKEVDQIPNGRVHAYIEDEGHIVNLDGTIGRWRQGYILHMDADGTFESSSSATVSDGNGVIIFGRRGGYYRGQIQDCKAHGIGRLFRPNGDVYVGNFRYNKQHGRGTYSFANGDMYSGD